MGSRWSVPQWGCDCGIITGCVTAVTLWELYSGTECSMKAIAIGVGISSVLLYYRRRRARCPATAERVVIITGCDSGLGYSLALHSYQIGLTVIAACYNIKGIGAQQLREYCGGHRLFMIDLDVTQESSVEDAVKKVRSFLQNHPNLELKALVNNAGVMVFGEFEWQTDRLIRSQIEVNFLGTLRVTKAFCSLIRQQQGRIIIISSHCANEALPGLAVYGGTKAALKAWADGLRVEEAKYGVKVISFIPGSFCNLSNILARQDDNAEEMETAMSPEDKLFFHDYFHCYNSYLSALSGTRDPVQLPDKTLYRKYEDALLCHYPLPYYEHGPLRYIIYHFLFKISPTRIRDHLVLSFMQMPTWEKNK